MRYFLEISYCGDAYSGWQRQLNAMTVQEVIEECLSTILQEKIAVIGCGRTDTGVHATQFFAHLDTSKKEFLKMRQSINSILPKDISVLNIFEVPLDAHARFDAISREYIYRINFEKDPFLVNRAYRIHQPQNLDMSRMQKASEILLEVNDFFSFCKTNTDVKTTLCDVSECRWQVDTKEMRFYIRSNRFLRGMVRLIVGMCLNVGWGKADLDTVKYLIINKERLDKPWSVPAYGLYLSNIEYPYLK
jgi:tRNA pseudouridine38-40 synthase